MTDEDLRRLIEDARKRKRIGIDLRRLLAIALFFFAITVVLTVVVMILSSCGGGAQNVLDTEDGKGCKPTTLSCRGDQLMICDADHEWAPLVTCGAYIPLGSRRCCIIDSAAGCFLEENCEARNE